MKLTFVFALGALAALSACRDQGPTYAADIAASPSAVKATESVSVAVTLVNLSNRVVIAPNPHSFKCGNHPFEIFDARGRRVQFPNVACTLEGYSGVELSPGATIEYTASWIPASTSIEGQPAGVGRYRLVGTFNGSSQVSVRSHAEVEVVP